jgi:hypothetical protein
VRGLGEEAEANRAELEHRAITHDDPGCPPNRPPNTRPPQRHHRADRGRQERDDRDHR